MLRVDLNSRTSNMPDFVQDESSFSSSVLPDDYVPDINSNRYSSDTGRLNNNGTMLLDLCKQTGLRILNWPRFLEKDDLFVNPPITG